MILSLVDESLSEINCKLELRRPSLETKSFRLSRTNTEYMRRNFRNFRNRQENIIKLDGQEVLLSKSFRHLELIIQQDRGIDEDIINRVRIR